MPDLVVFQIVFCPRSLSVFFFFSLPPLCIPQNGFNADLERRATVGASLSSVSFGKKSRLVSSQSIIGAPSACCGQLCNCLPTFGSSFRLMCLFLSGETSGNSGGKGTKKDSDSTHTYRCNSVISCVNFSGLVVLSLVRLITICAHHPPAPVTVRLYSTGDRPSLNAQIRFTEKKKGRPPTSTKAVVVFATCSIAPPPTVSGAPVMPEVSFLVWTR